MSKKTRKILFVICSIFFLLAAPSIILYSQGYRIDWKAKKITLTGGLFLKILPKQVEIYLDSKIRKKTDWFFGSVLIENLLPKKYTVKIKKELFHPWEKSLEIEEQKVTTATNIILFPKNPDFTILTGGTENFWFSPNQKKIILKEIEEKGWALKLYDPERNIKSHLISEEDIYQKEADLLALEFSPDSKMLYLKIGMTEQVKHFLLEIDKIPPALTEREETLPLLEDILSYLAIGEDIYYLDNWGHLFRTDKSLEPKTKITETPFPVKQETEYELKIFSDFIFLREAQVLYLFNLTSKSFEKFFEPVKDLKISPDFNKLVYWSDYEIWILFLKEKKSPPPKGAGERLFLIRFSEKITEVSWLNADYLIFSVGNKIKVTEIDERDRINIVNLAEFERPQIFFNKNNKKLYILSEGNLFESRVLFP